MQLRSPSPVLSDLTATETASGSDGMVESDETDDDDDTIGLIPKPSGEAGRPGRGGYNLKDTLGWAANDYEDFKVSSISIYSMRGLIHATEKG